MMSLSEKSRPLRSQSLTVSVHLSADHVCHMLIHLVGKLMELHGEGAVTGTKVERSGAAAATAATGTFHEPAVLESV